MYQIAIVEDEEIYAKLLEEFIHRYERDSFQQFKIRHYRDGSEIAENYRGGFDIILMDIQMKFMDGMTAAEMIRRRDPEVLIIFITMLSSLSSIFRFRRNLTGQSPGGAETGISIS